MDKLVAPAPKFLFLELVSSVVLHAPPFFYLIYSTKSPQKVGVLL